jgi:hypothetical protein
LTSIGSRECDESLHVARGPNFEFHARSIGPYLRDGRSRSGEIRERWLKATLLPRPDDRLDPRPESVGRADVIQQPASEALRRLACHREQHMLCTDHRMPASLGDRVSVTQQLFDLSR